MKSEIFNLIILDESGSMSHVTKQTISGCNETINTIRNAQKRFADTQEHFVSIFAFQSDGSRPSRYIIKNMPIDQVEHITDKQYEPNGCTPLYDAVGATLTDLKAITREKELAIGSVTIITDGMENSSTHYSRVQVAKMIEALTELGWNFNFIGANIDVQATASAIGIANSMEFCQDEEGTAKMFAHQNKSRMGWMKRTSESISKLNCCCASEPLNSEKLDSFYKDMKDASVDYFDESRGEDANTDY